MLANQEPYTRSKVDAIHLLALFEYPLMEVYGINDILAPFCDELKEFSKVKLKGSLFLIHNYIIIVYFRVTTSIFMDSRCAFKELYLHSSEIHQLIIGSVATRSLHQKHTGYVGNA